MSVSMRAWRCLTVVLLAVFVGFGCSPSLSPMPENGGAGRTDSVDGAASQTAVLGRVVNNDPAPSFFITLTQGASIIVNNQPVFLLPVSPTPIDPVTLQPVPERDAADLAVTSDPQDGRVFYSVFSPLQLLGNTQVRVAVKTVTGYSDFLHAISFFVRATRAGTTHSDMVPRGRHPLLSLVPGAGDINLTITGLRIQDGVGNLFPVMACHPPAEYAPFPPHPLAPPTNQQPMALFMRSADIDFLLFGKFIHLAYTVPNVIDTDQLRFPFLPGPDIALGTGEATAQVNGWMAFQNSAGVAYAFTEMDLDANPATGEFTRTIFEAAWNGTIDPNSRRVYYDASVDITAPPNPANPSPLAPAEEVYELAVATVCLTP